MNPLPRPRRSEILPKQPSTKGPAEMNHPG